MMISLKKIDLVIQFHDPFGLSKIFSIEAQIVVFSQISNTKPLHHLKNLVCYSQLECI